MSNSYILLCITHTCIENLFFVKLRMFEGPQKFFILLRIPLNQDLLYLGIIVIWENMKNVAKKYFY